MNDSNPADTRIIGYRDLSDSDIDMVNIIKMHGERLDGLIKSLEKDLMAQYGEADATESMRMECAQPARWLSIGRTHLQEGLMALTRAVTQPTTF